MCRRLDVHLTCMIEIALTVEFALAAVVMNLGRADPGISVNDTLLCSNNAKVGALASCDVYGLMRGQGEAGVDHSGVDGQRTVMITASVSASQQ
jgi:hypothetical protein